jgi:hypothetical protein
LASSAGITLATERPTWFLLLGLWGVALTLLAGASIGFALARRRTSGRSARLMALLSSLAGVCLLLRGVAVEVALLTDVGGVAGNVGPEQTHISLILWNPWFALGGLLFSAAGLQSWREQRIRSLGERRNGLSRRERPGSAVP